MKKFILPLFLTVLSAFIILPGTKVFADTNKSTLYLPENDAMLGRDRWYSTGNFTSTLTIDKHLGSNPKAQEKLWHYLFYYPENRQVAGAMTGSTLGTCVRASFGRFKNGRYQFGYATKYSNGAIFKGVVSNSVIMSSD